MYGRVLQTGDASDLLTITPARRRHALEALTALSKFSGCYDTLKKIREKYQLKWSDGNSEQFYLAYMESMVNGEQQLTQMMNWLREACSKLSNKDHQNALIYNTATGLRPTEAFNSLSLIHSEGEKYVRRKEGGIIILEHYKYPDLFIRRTKKAYISFITPELLGLAEQTSPMSWEALRSAINKRGMKTHLKNCRKIHATWLRQHGLEAEIVDLLQGRVPKSVFARHYFRPDFDPVKIKEAVSSLYKFIQL